LLNRSECKILLGYFEMEIVVTRIITKLNKIDAGSIQTALVVNTHAPKEGKDKGNDGQAH